MIVDTSLFIYTLALFNQWECLNQGNYHHEVSSSLFMESPVHTAISSSSFTPEHALSQLIEALDNDGYMILKKNDFSGITNTESKSSEIKNILGSHGFESFLSYLPSFSGHNLKPDMNGDTPTHIYSFNNDHYPNNEEKNMNINSHHLRRILSSDSGKAKGGEMVSDLLMVIVCVVFAGLASGLTQGLLSLDHMEMTIKAQSGNAKEKEYAKKLLPVINRHHLLLVTLMLWNASATEALPIFLSGLVPEYVAIIISVTLVLMFGEIIPASILTGPKQLEIAARLLPLVYVVLVIFFPVAYPVAKLLDWLIGEDEGLTIYSKRELATMMQLQHEEGQRRASVAGQHHHQTMQSEEVAIIGGALKYRDMKVSEVMTPASSCFMISLRETLSYKVSCV
jgi:hypothetical protein